MLGCQAASLSAKITHPSQLPARAGSGSRRALALPVVARGLGILGATALAAACTTPFAAPAEERARYLAGLRTGDCARISDAAFNEDCWLALASRSSPQTCPQLQNQHAIDECWFLAAERAGDETLCANAGEYSQDCARHLFVTALSRTFGTRGINPANDAHVERLIREYGIPAGTMRPWLEYYKWALADSGDETACRRVVDPGRREACATAIAELRDPARRGGPNPRPQ